MSESIPVLVVDDSPSICKSISDLLTTNGFDVTVVHDGLDAITAAKKRKFDVVTLDVEMPRMPGIDVLRILKAMDPDVFVIMISGQSAMQTALHAIRLGAYDYISKPFEPEDVLLNVQRAIHERGLILENRRLIQDLRSLNENLEDLVGQRTKELEHAHTELLAGHQRLEDAYRMLKELDEMKVKFLAIASHELRTPLTTIRGYSSWLSSGRRTPEQQTHAFNAMERSIDRLVAIVSEITDIARLREKRLFLHRESIDLAKIVGLVLHEMKPFVDERRQHLEANLADELPPVFVDKTRVHQVLSNLVLNAIRYTPDGGRITIDAAQEAITNGFVHVRICDTGIGIEENQLVKIFEEFYEAASHQHHHSGTFQFKSGGIGLGLSLVRGIIEEHGGRIWAESARSKGGSGSIFHFLLPEK